MSSLKYWMWLSCARAIASRRMLALVDHFGTPENVYYAGKTDYEQVPGISAGEIKSLEDKSMARAERILEDCRKKNIGLLTINDAAYPERLKNIYDPPCLLYLRGRLPNIDEEAAIGVVGTRKSSAYGVSVTERLCFELAAAGMMIVSGLAEGIDTAAHMGAARAGAVSVAVLGCGVDVVYPKKNAGLYEHIAASGVLLSEYPPGTPAYGYNFPVRNRIISGLSVGVLVTEAPARSGALITASHALEQGKDVFAVPGNIGAESSEGCNALLHDGAQIVTGSLDILREYLPLYPHKISLSRTPAQTRLKPAEKQIPGPEKPELLLEEKIKDFTAEQRTIIVTIARMPLHVDDIIERTGLSAREVLSQLTMLEMESAVRQTPGKYFELGDLLK